MTTYEARKHAQKEQEMDEVLVSRSSVESLKTQVAIIAELAVGLMEGEPAVFKQGYTFANALMAACDAHGLSDRIVVAMVAERMHERLMEQARASEVCLDES